MCCTSFQPLEVIFLTANLELKRYARESGVTLWRVAEELGMSDHQFSRKLRHELPDCDHQRVRAIIERLAAEDAAVKEGRP